MVIVTYLYDGTGGGFDELNEDSYDDGKQRRTTGIVMVAM